MERVANELVIDNSPTGYIMNLTTPYGMPTENMSRKIKYMIGEVRKLSDILRVKGKISQQMIKPTAIMIISIIITNGAFLHN